MTRQLKFGWVLPSAKDTAAADYLTLVTNALEYVQSRFESVWVGDHLQFDNDVLLECTTTIAYLARAYPKLEFASFLCQSFRNPALVAKNAANLQLLTADRFILGIGAGWKV